jgi:hypothetical protein
LGTRLDESVATLTGLLAVSTRSPLSATGIYGRDCSMRVDTAPSSSHDK